MLYKNLVVLRKCQKKLDPFHVSITLAHSDLNNSFTAADIN